jgi:hypothetical protein
MNHMPSASISLPIPLFEDDVIIPLSDRKTVVTLLADDCRWPFGDSAGRDFHYYGKWKSDGRL